jgi:hypothetical protein
MPLLVAEVTFVIGVVPIVTGTRLAASLSTSAICCLLLSANSFGVAQIMAEATGLRAIIHSNDFAGSSVHTVSNRGHSRCILLDHVKHIRLLVNHTRIEFLSNLVLNCF